MTLLLWGGGKVFFIQLKAGEKETVLHLKRDSIALEVQREKGRFEAYLKNKPGDPNAVQMLARAEKALTDWTALEAAAKAVGAIPVYLKLGKQVDPNALKAALGL